MATTFCYQPNILSKNLNEYSNYLITRVGVFTQKNCIKLICLYHSGNDQFCLADYFGSPVNSNEIRFSPNNMRSRYLVDTPIMGGSPPKKKRPNNPTKYQGFPFYKLDVFGKHFHLSGDNINYYITMSLFEYLKRLDEFFFILIHNDSDHRMLDGWMVALLNPLASLPIYLFILYKAARKTAHIPWLFIVFNAITVVITAVTA